MDDPGNILIHERQRGNSGLCLRMEELLDCFLSKEEDHWKDRCLRFLNAQGGLISADDTTSAVASRLGLALVFVVIIRLLANEFP